MPLRTPLCDLLGIEFPLLQSGMGGIAGPALVAAVSNAGGLGIVAGHGATPAELREAVAETRRLTSRPFGVNLLMPDDLVRPEPSESVQESDRVQGVLNPMRGAVGVEPKRGLPPAPAADIHEKVEVILEAGVPVFSVGLGNPGAELVARCHARGMRVVAMATQVEDARALAAAGVDAVVAQGGEAGGHQSQFTKARPGAGQVGTMVLVPEIVDALEVPVIAAGGIVDGRGLVAALALGAQGVLMGTRFLATRESSAVPVYKDAVLAAGSGDTTITDAASGRYARVIRNAFTEEYAQSEAPVLPYAWHTRATADLFQGARDSGDPRYMGLWAGQASGRIQDLPSATEVVARLRAEAEEVMARFR